MTTASWTTIDDLVRDVRLVVCDMDGTLLTDDGAIPESFWSVLDLMRSRGITFVPASGRQYATLAHLFADDNDGISYIAENGNLFVHQGKPISSTAVDHETVQKVIALARAATSTRDLGLVVCGLNSAYVERTDRPFLDEVEKYYAKLAIVDDLTAVDDSVLKLAVFDFADAQQCHQEAFASITDQQVVISGKHWVDIMRPDVDKGRAVRALQRELGVTPAQTVVFGDYLNDLQMLDAAEWSFAMGNAHPTVKAKARFIAPTNAEEGVVVVLSRLLGA